MWRNVTGDCPVDTGLCELTELVKSIKNRCDIYLSIREIPELQAQLYTILEDLCEDAQTILDEYCTEREQ